MLTTPSSAITALIPNPNTLGFTSFTGEPVFIVPMADSDISELSIETGELQAINAPGAPQMSLSPMIPHPINAPVSAQTNISAAAAQNQPATVIPTQHIGQSRETELQKQVKPLLGPQPDEDQQGIDVIVPPQAPKPADAGSGKTTPPQADHPKTQQPKIEQPKTDQPTDGTKRPEEAPPRRTHSLCGGGRRFLCPSRFLHPWNAKWGQQRTTHFGPTSPRIHQMGRCSRRSSEQSASPAAFTLRWPNHAGSACTGSPAGSRPADRHDRG